MADASTIDPLATPPATGDRLIVITPDDHRGVLWVISILCLIYTLTLLGIRSSARRREFGWDDGVAAASTISATVYYVMTFVAINNGFGKTYRNVTPSGADVIGKLIIACDVFLFLTLTFTKISVVLLCRRLFSASMKKHLVICDITAGLCVAWCLAAILATTISCGPLEQIGYETDFCSSLVPRWIGVGAVDAMLECIIVGLAISVVQPLQMSTKKKIPVILSFAPRLVLIILTGLHIHTLDRTTTHLNRGVAIVEPMVYLQVQMLYAVFSAAIPALNRWLRKFDSSMGNAWQATSQNYGAGGSSVDRKTRSNNFPLHPLKSKESASRSVRRSADEEPINTINSTFQPHPVNYIASVSGRDQAEVESNKSQDSQHSEAKIIRKEQRWQVSYDYNDRHGDLRAPVDQTQ